MCYSGSVTTVPGRSPWSLSSRGARVPINRKDNMIYTITTYTIALVFLAIVVVGLSQVIGFYEFPVSTN